MTKLKKWPGSDGESGRQTTGQPFIVCASWGWGRESMALKTRDTEERTPWYIRKAVSPDMMMRLPSSYQSSLSFFSSGGSL